MSVKVVFCYAHKDEPFLKKLKLHLKVLERQERIITWCYRDIHAGRNWRSEIDENLDSAEIILLLLSPDFMASDYCYSVEMKQALKRHEQGTALVIPVILRPTLWKDTPLGELQALPKDAKPVSGWRPQDNAFFDIANRLGQLLFSFATRTKQGQEVEQPVSTLSIIDSTRDDLASIADVPFFIEDGLSEPITSPLLVKPFFTIKANRGIGDVDFSSDGKRLAFNNFADGKVQIWQCNNQLRIMATDDYTRAYCIALSPDGRKIVMGDHQFLYIANSLTGSALTYLDVQRRDPYGEPANCLAFSSNGKYVLSGADDGTVRLWDSFTGELVKTFHIDGLCSCLAFAPNCQRMLAGMDNGSIFLWDVSCDNPLTILHGHTGTISSVTFSYDNHKVLTGSEDATACLWSVTTGEVLSCIEGPLNPVLHASFSPKNRFVIVCYESGEVSLWQMRGVKKMVLLRKYHSSCPITIKNVHWEDEKQVTFAGFRKETQHLYCFRLDFSNKADHDGFKEQ